MSYLKISPIEGESLASYIQRFGLENGIRNYDVIRLVEPGLLTDVRKSHEVLFKYDVRKFMVELLEDKDLEFSDEQLTGMNFNSLIQKIDADIPNPLQSRILSGQIDLRLKFCPRCLEETMAYQLLWQVKEITICIKHRIKLTSSCYECGSLIPVLPSSGEVGVCPSCLARLKNSPDIEVGREDLGENCNFYTDWSQMMAIKEPVPKIEGISSFSSLAAGLLSLRFKGQKYPSTRLSRTDQSLKQVYKKNSKATPSLSTIFKILRESNCSIEEFSKLTLSEDFLKALGANAFKRPHITPNRERLSDEELVKRVTDKINRLYLNGEKISKRKLKKFFRLDKSFDQLRIDHIIKTFNEKLQKEKAHVQVENLELNLNNLFNNWSYERFVTWDDLKDCLQISRTTLRARHPDFFKALQKRVNEFNRVLREDKEQRYIDVADEIIKDNKAQGNQTTLKEICEYLGLEPKSVGRYSEFVKFVKENKM